MATETVTNPANETISLREQADEHPLDLAAESRAADETDAPSAKADASWASLPVEQHSAATANVNVYLDNFISVVQGGSRESCQMLWHILHQIYRVFRRNEEKDTKRKDPISLKKLGQGDGAWST